MYLDKNFKLIKKDKYIILSIVGFFFLCFVALFIVTSFYKYDLAIAKEFNKAMQYDFFKGWTGYFILDAYILIISILVPVGFVLLESLYAYLRRNKQSSFGSKHPSSIRWFYLIGMIVLPIVDWLLLASYCFNDYGFGTGFIYWFIIDWKYIIPIYVVSGLLNMAVFYSLLYYVHYDLAKREDFLSSRIWQKAIITFIFVLFIYIPVLVLKNGFGRPYLWNIEWHDYLDKIKDFDPNRYSHYMHQTSVNLGWHNGHLDASFPSDLQDWPWWKVARGYFDRKTNYYEMLPSGDAFPSGHMAATMSILVACCWVLFNDAKTRKQATLKWLVFGIGMLYFLNLFFSLEISVNHWTSDMSFTLIWAPFAFIIAYEIDHSVTKIVLAEENKNVVIK